MPGRAPWRAPRRIVTDTTIDFYADLSIPELLRVRDDDVLRLLTPAIEVLDVTGCKHVTDAAIPPNLRILRASCTNITAVASPNLVELDVGYCKRFSLIVENCPKLMRLNVERCGLTALPHNIGDLHLHFLDASGNLLKELPRSIADLDVECTLILQDNPLQTPPLAIASQGILAIRHFFS